MGGVVERCETMVNNSFEPMLIACGYQCIPSPKTELLFPAWLIRLPSNDEDRKQHKQHHHEAYRWRSKRDFLRLFRAAVAAGNGTIQPPKAALQKLSNQAPWKTPGSPPLEYDNSDWQELEQKDPNRTVSDNYHVSMKKSIMLVDRFLQSCSRWESLRPVWKEFCRPLDTHGLVSNYRDNATRENRPTGITSPRESSTLGQYFCTEENANQLMDLTFAWIQQQQKQQQQLAPKTTTGMSNNWVFLEPSCGHGQLVWTLMERLKRVLLDGTEIVGYDLDDNAIQLCRLHQQQLHHYHHDSVTWVSGNFLDSPSPSHGKTTTVVCVGGPPYTSRHGATMERDLPQLFLNHLFQIWKADFCAFILPRRYAKNPPQVPIGWKCETHEMASSTFYFQGTVEVTQPSIIQTFCRII